MAGSPRRTPVGQAQQAATPGRTTLTEGVNILLETIGEMPVSSIENTTASEVWVASRALLEVHKEGQTRGWGWNTDYGFPFPVNSRRELHLPTNVVRWVPDRYEWGRRFQQRGQRVWDREAMNYRLPLEVKEVRADVVWLLPWDDCPEQFNRWAITRGARVFGARVLGNESLVKFSLKDESDAMLELQRMESENEQWNLLTDGPGMPLRAFPTYQPGRSLVERNVARGWPLG